MAKYFNSVCVTLSISTQKHTGKLEYIFKLINLMIFLLFYSFPVALIFYIS